MDGHTHSDYYFKQRAVLRKLFFFCNNLNASLIEKKFVLFTSLQESFILTIIKKSKTIDDGADMVKREHFCTVVGNVT